MFTLSIALLLTPHYMKAVGEMLINLVEIISNFQTQREGSLVLTSIERLE